MSAAHYKLDNLVGILDYNGLQIDGDITKVMNPTPFDKKFEAFGFNVIKIDAHYVTEIDDAIQNAKACKGKPTAIIASSTKGKGVSYMENAVNWHGAAPNAEQYETAMNELKEVLNGLEG